MPADLRIHEIAAPKRNNAPEGALRDINNRVDYFLSVFFLAAGLVVVVLG